MKEVQKRCDVLCIGGGIAGLMAAIKACDLGAKILVVEKSNTVRSGSGGMGNDHFQCYIPEVHGDFDVFMRDVFYGQMGGHLRMLDTEYVHYWLKNTFEIVKLWESWGIPMKYQGRYEFAGHGFPGKQLTHLKYSGVSQKPILTKEALKRGVEIVNRVMVFDLLRDRSGSVVGALGLDTREGELISFEAKSVILGTGCCNRVYPSMTPASENNRAFPVTCTGDGRAMAYRAGAELTNLEMVMRHAGPKYLARCGQATWIGVLRDSGGNPVGPWVTKPERLYGDITTEVSKTIFEDHVKSGKGPVYMDMNGISKEDRDYMIHWLRNEGNGVIIDYVNEEGYDLGKSAIEFRTLEMMVDGGVRANYKGETSVKGLYAAGDDVWPTMSHAAVMGSSAGENAGKYAKGMEPPDVEEARADIKKWKALLEEIRTRKEGAKWREALSAMQQIMLDYCGSVRSEPLLSAGLDVLRSLKKKVRSSLLAKNAHELTNCLQVLNLVDIGELVFLSALDRKETRMHHVRPDYPLTDPLLGDKVHLIKQSNGEPVLEWIEVKR
jgi:succinate dehydrogenase/fumarate reductase flavoprotein subunit